MIGPPADGGTREEIETASARVRVGGDEPFAQGSGSDHLAVGGDVANDPTVGVCRPTPFSGAGVQRFHLAISRTDIQRPIGNNGGTQDDVAQVVLPKRCTSAPIQGQNTVVRENRNTPSTRLPPGNCRKENQSRKSRAPARCRHQGPQPGRTQLWCKPARPRRRA